MDSEKKFPKVSDDKNKQRSRSLQINEIEKKKTLPKERQSKERSSILKIASSATLPSNLQVFVRVRPLINLESIKTKQKCIKLLSQTKLICDDEREFNFDIIFGEDSCQDQIFNKAIKTNLEKALVGYNCCIFAYGQTGAGKTHTMGTNLTKETISDIELGVIPRSIKYLFDSFKESKEYLFITTISLIELYNEEIIDLLNFKNSKQFTLREDKFGQVFISGLTEYSISDSTEALNLIFSGTQNRKTAATHSNENSSRSHAIFIVYIDKVNKLTKDKTSFKINFVDLAGSERIKKSGATGERFKESVSINSGLLALSKVIMSLADDKKGTNIHIPYRESKLTRILKDSLGGNSITIMLACISPSDLNLEETVNTLNYASFARTIKIKPIQNLELNLSDSKGIVENLMKEIELLKNELNEYKEGKRKSKGHSKKKLLAPDFSEKKVADLIMDDDSSIDEILTQENQLDFKKFEEIKCENKILKSIIKALRQRESGLVEKLATKSENTKEQGYEQLNEKHEEETIIDDIEKLKNQYNNHENNIISENMLKELEEENDNVSDVKNTELGQMNSKKDRSRPLKTYEVINKQTNSLIDEKKNNLTNNHLETNISDLNEKIKKLKEFQNSIKDKLIENDYYKNKIVILKNTEIDLIKSDLIDKNKLVRNLENENLKQIETLEIKNNTIMNLKSQLRNKSVDLNRCNTKSRPLDTLNTNESPPHLKKNISKVNVILDKEIVTDEAKYRKRNSFNDLDQNYIVNIKNIIRQIEEEVMKKLKLEKKLKAVYKEKTNFSNLISKLEDKFELKKNENLKLKTQYEEQIKLIELEDSFENNREKNLLIQKIKIVSTKLENVEQRTEKINSIKVLTINDLNSTEISINNQICQCEIRISDLKYQIESNNCSKSRPTFTSNTKSKSNIYSPILITKKTEDNYESNGDNHSLDRIDLDNVDQEKVIELDRVYKEKIEFLENKLKILNEKFSSNNEHNISKIEINQMNSVNNQISYNNYMVNINPIKDENSSSPKKTSYDSHSKVVNKIPSKKIPETREDKRNSTKINSKLPPKVSKQQNSIMKIETIKEGRSNSILNKGYNSTNKSPLIENLSN